jgi:hypothetical protein
MNDGPISFLKSWEGFLPPNTVVMARRRAFEGELTHAAANGAATRDVSNAARAESPALETYRIAFEAPGINEPAARDLFQKIASALSLASDEYFASPEPAPPTVQAEVTIRFVATETESSGWQGSVLSTYSLAAMLAKPDLKKAVWAQLKSAPGIAPARRN